MADRIFSSLQESYVKHTKDIIVTKPSTNVLENYKDPIELKFDQLEKQINEETSRIESEQRARKSQLQKDQLKEIHRFVANMEASDQVQDDASASSPAGLKNVI
jgi:hypothetical protein